ncbi:hypothetical protein [Cellulomonas telluris]|uniref:hypothetical protein n=1 Tax=Cellulomonas telluris TaxID=2306636 RepID=UPI0010A8FA30|nr:hypothetical protein [Cellulomonas telluris]
MTTRLLLEGDDLAELMTHVRTQFGPGARIVQAERVRTGGLAGFFAKERYELTVDVPDEPDQPVRRFAHRPPVPAAPAAGLEALLDAADRAEAGPEAEPAAAQAEGAVARASEEGRVSTASADFASVLEQVRAGVGIPPADVEVPAPAPSRPAPAPAAPVATPAPGSAVLRGELARLGVPAAVLDAGPVTLTAVLGRIPVPPPPPRGAGDVLVVAGAGDDAAAVARTLVARWRLADDALVAVEPGRGALPARLTGPRPAGAASRDGGPTVVALRVGPEAHDRAVAAGVLARVRADQVWAVVDARTKPADAAAWVAAVGAERPVDALAVLGLLDTTGPGTVLELERPVAWIDGLPASRLVWAAALGQELDAALG